MTTVDIPPALCREMLSIVVFLRYKGLLKVNIKNISQTLCLFTEQGA